MSKLKLKNRVTCVLILITAFIGCLGIVGTLNVGGGDMPRANAEVQVNIADDIADEYAFGDVLKIPVCTFEKEGSSALGVASLQYPNGTFTNKTEVTLNQSGKYVLKYIATLGGKVYTKEYAFDVLGRLASYNNPKTTVSYGVCNAYGANSTGLMVSIANGDAITFDHVFDMSDISMSTKLLDGFIVPSAQGSVDFSKMVFTFTDIEDPSVQLVYHGNFHDDVNSYGLTFFTAAGNGQVQCGLEHVGKLHVGSTLGCMVPHSFMAMDTGLYWGAQKPVAAAPDNRTFCISYDSKTNQAWAGGKIISDLDDSNYYDSLWLGFPSGKAKLTISALNYNNASANMCFTEILGVDLSAENYIDTDAPVITINNDGEKMPDAVVGGTYPIPTATAADQVNGVQDVKVSVWYNYGTANEKMVNVVDNRFKVSRVGVYAIVYEASDYSGNTAREVLWVRANLSQYMEKLSIAIDENYNKTIDVGTLQSLPEVTVNGGSGEYQVTYSLEKGREVGDIIDGIFSLQKAGEWTLTCTVVDEVGNMAVDVCTLTGVISDKPVIVDEPSFPIAYVSGSTYQLPILFAYDYKSGTKEQKICDVRVEYNGKSDAYTSGEDFVPVVENHKDTLRIFYTCEGELLFQKEVPVLIVFDKEKIPGNTDRYRDVINVEKYFFTRDDVTFSNYQELDGISGMRVTANQATDSALISFANAQLANAFSLNFMTVPNASKFSHINVILYDGVNRNISIKATLTKADGQTLLTVGDTEIPLNLDLDSANGVAYSLGYANNKIIVNGTTSIDVSTMEDGEAFNGFPSQKVYFDIEMCNVEAGAEIFLSKICNINVSNKQDTTGPFVTTMGTLQTNAFKDSVYTLSKVVACDVLCPNTKAYLTVIAPDGTVARSVDGVKLSNVDATEEYEIKLSSYGIYSISVIASEANGWKYSNESYFDYVISVVDGEAPKITFKGKFDTNLKVGDTLVIPSYKVTDNFTPAEEITVMTMIINPKGMPIYLYGDTNAVRCEYAGVYKVLIYAYDEMGNLTTFETNVTVK